MEETESDPSSQAEQVSTQQEHQENGNTNALPSREPAVSVWGKVNGNMNSNQPRQSASLVEIMAEQNECNVVVQAAYGQNVSLADTMAEQERILRSFQANKVGLGGDDASNEHDESKLSHTPQTDEEQDDIIMMVMKQSLAEYTATHKADVGQGGDLSKGTILYNESVSTLEMLEGLETVEPLRSDASQLATASTHANEPFLNSSVHSSSPVEVLHQSEPTLSTRTDRPTLSDREFSQRTLKEIERTEAVIDNPHAAEEERRRRQLGRSSTSPMPVPRKAALTGRRAPTTPLSRTWSGHLHERSRNEMILEARKHLSSREILEIEQALRDADQEPISSQPAVRRASDSPTTSKSGLPSRQRHSDFPLPSPRTQRRGPPLSPVRRGLSHSPSNAQSRPMAAPSSSDYTSQPSSAGNSSRGTTTPSRTSIPVAPPPIVAATGGVQGEFISEDEAAAIEAALREADAKAEEESLMLAFQMLQEEIQQLAHAQGNRSVERNRQGNVRSMTRAEIEYEAQRTSERYEGPSWVGAIPTNGPSRLHPLEREALAQSRAQAPGVVSDSRPPARHPLEENEEFDQTTAGFRMNTGTSQQWARRDRNTIIGPNNEVRTKHDVEVQGQANAQYLGLEPDDFGLRAHVGNQAFNSFKRSMKQTHKGVAAHGTGRAGTDSEGVKGKAMDPNARLQISRAINSGLIEKCGGAVKQGKEAIVYHADQGAGSQGFDVAVKIFKRITDFRSRGDYVEGDPRYPGQVYRKASEREQLEMWAEKEYRNLIRANRAKVPVPTPLHYKDNIIFMRFMGNDGWPAPQIREIEMRKGSKKWDVMYTQVMEAIRRLYVGARLVHGDLSEYNILVAPAFQVDNLISSVDDTSNDLQTVLIDFGQAVDIRHPESMTLLRRDLERVRTFFTKQGVKTLGLDDAIEFVASDVRQEEGEVEENGTPPSTEKGESIK